MSYLSFIVASLWMVIRGGTEGKPFIYEGLDAYLNLVVGLERFFFLASLVVFAIALTIVLVLAIISKAREGVFLIPCGCLVLIVTGLGVLLEGWTLLLATGMANSVSAAGMVDETRFAIFALLMLFFGLG